MKNVTLSLDDDTYRRARIVAAERGQSVSALVRDLLGSLSAPPPDAQSDLARVFATLDRSRARFAAGKRLARDKLYAR